MANSTAPRRVPTEVERAAAAVEAGHAWRAPAVPGFRVVYVPAQPAKPEVHTCDIPQSASALFAVDLEMPKRGTVIECGECGQRWVADYHSHVRLWSPMPRRRWWHRLTRRNP